MPSLSKLYVNAAATAARRRVILPALFFVLAFPLAGVVEEMQSGRQPLCRTEVGDPADSERWWTILEESLPADLAATAEQIVSFLWDQALDLALVSGAENLGCYGVKQGCADPR